MKKTFLVVYEKGKRSYSGFAPDVPGCGSVGDSLEEMRNNLRDALEFYMETSTELGFALPEPTTTTVTLPIEGELDLKTTYVVEHMAVRVSRTKQSPSKPRSLPKIKRRELTAA